MLDEGIVIEGPTMFKYQVCIVSSFKKKTKTEVLGLSELSGIGQTLCVSIPQSSGFHAVVYKQFPVGSKCYILELSEARGRTSVSPAAPLLLVMSHGRILLSAIS